MHGPTGTPQRMTKPQDWKTTNRLLDQLPDDVCDRVGPHLQRVPLVAGKVLYESSAQQGHIYFPRTGVVSLLYVMDDGVTGEIAMVGNEGAVGFAVLVDSMATPTRAEVQIDGEAWMLKSETIDAEFKRGGAFQLILLRYTQLMLSQMAQAVICNRHHSVEKQLCRWLLLACDRANSERLQLTQEAISNLLGVRREAISEAASRLQDAKLIAYSRGNIQLLDRDGLEARSCGCYRAVRDEQARMMKSLRDP